MRDTQRYWIKTIAMDILLIGIGRCIGRGGGVPQETEMTQPEDYRRLLMTMA